MTKTEQIEELFFSAVDEINKQLPRNKQLPKTKTAVLIGEQGRIDSLALVNLVVAVEAKIEEKYCVSLVILDSSIFSKNSPLKTVGSFIEHLESLLDQKLNAN